MARVLVVDDDPDFVEITRLILKAEGYQVDTAPNGDMALRLMRSSPPDVVILDVMMAGVLDGVHVAREMSEDDVLQRVPVIMVSAITGSSMSEVFPTDEYLPIAAWISKPAQPADLLRKIAKAIQAPGA